MGCAVLQLIDVRVHLPHDPDEAPWAGKGKGKGKDKGKHSKGQSNNYVDQVAEKDGFAQAVMEVVDAFMNSDDLATVACSKGKHRSPVVAAVAGNVLRRVGVDVAVFELALAWRFTVQFHLEELAAWLRGELDEVSPPSSYASFGSLVGVAESSEAKQALKRVALRCERAWVDRFGSNRVEAVEAVVTRPSVESVATQTELVVDVPSSATQTVPEMPPGDCLSHRDWCVTNSLHLDTEAVRRLRQLGAENLAKMQRLVTNLEMKIQQGSRSLDNPSRFTVRCVGNAFRELGKDILP